MKNNRFRGILSLVLSCLLILLVTPRALAVSPDQDFVGGKGIIDFPSSGQPIAELFNQYGGDAKDVCFTMTNTGEKVIGIYFDGSTNNGKLYTHKSKEVGLKRTGRELIPGTSVLLCFNRIHSVVVQCPNRQEDISDELLSADPFPQVELLGCRLEWEVTNLWKNLY